jgi:hypothetical protein
VGARGVGEDRVRGDWFSAEKVRSWRGGFDRGAAARGRGSDRVLELQQEFKINTLLHFFSLPGPIDHDQSSARSLGSFDQKKNTEAETSSVWEFFGT